MILSKSSVDKKSQPISESFQVLKWKLITLLLLVKLNHFSDLLNALIQMSHSKLRTSPSSVLCVKKEEVEESSLTLLIRLLWVKLPISPLQVANKNLLWEVNSIGSYSLSQLLLSYWVSFSSSCLNSSLDIHGSNVSFSELAF